MATLVNPVPRWNRKTILSLLGAMVLAAVLVVLAFRGVSFAELGTLLKSSRPEPLIAVVLAAAAALLIRALRWRILLVAERPVKTVEVFWSTCIGYFGNNLLPARAGELLRTAAISRRSGIGFTYVLATALSERLTDVIFVVLIASVSLLYVPVLPHWLRTAPQGLSALCILGIVFIGVAPHFENQLMRLLDALPLPKALHARLQRMAQQFLLGMKAYHSVDRLLRFILLTFIAWSLDVFGASLTARAMGFSLDIPSTFVFLAALGLSSALPSTPGYVGIYQYVAVTVLVPFGLTKSQALAEVLVYQAGSYLAALVLGGIGLWSMRDVIHRRKEDPASTHIDTSQPAFSID